MGGGKILTKYPHNSMIILSRRTISLFIALSQLGQFSLPCEEGPSIVAYLLTLGSVLLVLASMPLSLMFVVKVVQVRLLLNPIRS